MSNIVLWMVGFVFLVPSGLEQPAGQTWMSDYGAALKAAKDARKPLLVVLDGTASQPETFETTSFSTPKGNNKAVLARYVLCRVDTTTPYGQAVAKNFRASQFPTTVIIDRTASSIIYAKTGQLSDQELQTALVTHQQGRIPVRQATVVCTH